MLTLKVKCIAESLYESFDEKKFTLLTTNVTLDFIFNEINKFIPLPDSDECSEAYFVSYLAEKYIKESNTE